MIIKSCTIRNIHAYLLKAFLSRGLYNTQKHPCASPCLSRLQPEKKRVKLYVCAGVRILMWKYSKLPLHKFSSLFFNPQPEKKTVNLLCMCVYMYFVLCSTWKHPCASPCLPVLQIWHSRSKYACTIFMQCLYAISAPTLDIGPLPRSNFPIMHTNMYTNTHKHSHYSHLPCMGNICSYQHCLLCPLSVICARIYTHIRIQSYTCICIHTRTVM
jgi:hypothetical protein